MHKVYFLIKNSSVLKCDLDCCGYRCMDSPNGEYKVIFDEITCYKKGELGVGAHADRSFTIVDKAKNILHSELVPRSIWFSMPEEVYFDESWIALLSRRNSQKTLKVFNIKSERLETEREKTPLYDKVLLLLEDSTNFSSTDS